SLSPALDWDGQNFAREQGEALLREILEAGSLDEAKVAAANLRTLARPFLNWAGKAERLSFDVPTLPFFVHERLSTKAIIETLQGHRRPEPKTLFDLFSDPQHPITDQMLRAYDDCPIRSLQPTVDLGLRRSSTQQALVHRLDPAGAQAAVILDELTGADEISFQMFIA